MRGFPESKSGGVRTTIAMHCGCRIFDMAAKVKKFAGIMLNQSKVTFK